MGKRESAMGKRESTMGKREYTFADGSRPRMGKRNPVEETNSLDRGKKHYVLLTFGTNTHQKMKIKPSPLFSRQKKMLWQKRIFDLSSEEECLISEVLCTQLRSIPRVGSNHGANLIFSTFSTFGGKLFPIQTSKVLCIQLRSCR